MGSGLLATVADFVPFAVTVDPRGDIRLLGCRTPALSCALWPEPERPQARHLRRVRLRPGDRGWPPALGIRPRNHRRRRHGRGPHQPGDDRPGAQDLPTEVHDQPAQESLYEAVWGRGSTRRDDPEDHGQRRTLEFPPPPGHSRGPFHAPSPSSAFSARGPAALVGEWSGQFTRGEGRRVPDLLPNGSKPAIG